MEGGRKGGRDRRQCISICMLVAIPVSLHNNIMLFAPARTEHGVLIIVSRRIHARTNIILNYSLNNTPFLHSTSPFSSPSPFVHHSWITLEQGKTTADALGDVWRGLEVVEAATRVGSELLVRVKNERRE